MAVSTLGEAHDLGWRLTFYCRHGRRDGMKSVRPCVNSVYADLEAMLWTHGRDCPITYLEGRLKCPRCGSRRVMIAFEPPSGGSRMRASG